MKTKFPAGVRFLFLWMSAASLSAAPLLDEPVDVKLKNGQVLHAAQAKSFTASTVLVKSAEGVQTVAYEQFPEEHQAALQAKRPAKRTDAQIEADREKARKNQPPAPPRVERSAPIAASEDAPDLYSGLRIDSFQAKGNFVEVTIFNTADAPRGVRPWRLIAQLSSEEYVRGADFVETDSSDNVKTILRDDQIIPANTSATFTLIFGRAMKGGTVQKVGWYR